MAALALLSACGRRPSGIQPIFVEGRAVTMAGDTAYALTGGGRSGLWIKSLLTGESREIGAQILKSPAHAQWFNGDWYVSDVENGKSVIVVLGADGTLKRRIPADRHTDASHQFAVLPDGRLILEGRGGKLIALQDDKESTFVVTEQSSRTGLLIAASGGVIHAIPDQYVTLYNEFGHIRWRIDWPWASTAFISDLSVDGNARVHVIAGVPSQGTFVVYTLSTQTGEAVRWSIPGRAATFTVDPLGRLEPGKAEDWTN